MKLLVLLVLSCCSLRVLQAQEQGEEGGEGGEAGAEVSPCAISRERLESVARALFPEEYNVSINCLSFDGVGALERGIVSGVNSTGGAGGMRLVLTCVEDVIVSTQSSQLPVELEAEMACLTCTDAADESAICTEECVSPCERCYEETNRCTRCTACVASSSQSCTGGVLAGSACASACRNQAAVANPELFNFCDCPLEYYRELLSFPPADEIEGEIEVPDPCESNPSLGNFQCVSACTDGREPNEELNHCFACGLEYCVRCNSTLRECTICLEHTVLFEHECFACPLATVALNGLIQEEELAVELRDQELRQIELAVSLPILSVLVVIIFVGMSLFAHHRYPHIAHHGHKRHRTKPEDFDDIPQDNEPATPNTPSDVWRARPTVRLR